MKFINKYWYYLLIFIPLYMIITYNFFIDSDMWFLLNMGKYIVNHGFPYIDPFTMHEGLHLIIQQWLSDVLFYFVYSFLGSKGLMIILIVMVFIISYYLYKLFYLQSNNKIMSYIFMVLCITLIAINFCFRTRPQLFTYLILILELLFLEKYVKSKNNKYLYILPVLSILLINLHSSMWVFQFIILLPYLVNGIKCKKFNKSKYSIKPLIIIMIIMFILGFINPYGYKNVFYLYYSYGYKELNLFIKEMLSPSFSNIELKIWILLIGLILFIINYFKYKLDSRHFLFILGCSILYLNHDKMFPYFVIVYFYSLSYLLKDFKFKIKDYLILYVFKIFIFILGIIIIPLMIFFGIREVKLMSYIEDIGEYLLDNYEKDIRIYNEFKDGAYLEYIGYKPFIDGRAELFYKRFNKKDDIFIDYYQVNTDYNYDIDSFIKKYNFDIFIVDSNSIIDSYLDNNYSKIYTLYVGEDDNIPVYNVYVREEE